MVRPPSALRALLLTLLAVLCTAAAGPSDREVLELSQHGTVLGPMPRDATPSDADDSAALEEFVRGLEAMGQERYSDAAGTFDAVFERTGWPEARYNGALAWYAAGRFDVALERADAAAGLLGGDLGVLYLRGVLLQATGRHLDASAVIAESLEKSRGSGSKMDEAIALLNLGTSAALLGRPEEAIERFAAVRALGKTLQSPVLGAAAWMGEARVHLVRGDRAAADAALEEARRLGRRQGYDAARADADLSLAAVAFAEGRVAKARQLLQSAAAHLEAVPDASIQASMLLTVADLQHELGDVAVAEDSIRRATRLFDQGGLEVGRAHALTLQGAWALDADRIADAERLLQEALAVQDRYQVPLARAETQRHLAAVRIGQGRVDEALRLVEEALAVFVGAQALELERAAQVVLCEVRSMQGELDAARAAADRAIELSAQVGDAREVHRARSELAVLRAAQGDLQGASEELGRIPAAAFARLPARQRARVHLQLAWSLRSAGDLDEAAARGRRALDATAEGEGMEKLASGAREAVVYSLVEAGRSDEAEAFLQDAGGDADLAAYVRSKRTIDTYNEGVRLLEGGDLEAAVAAFEELAREPDPDPERRGLVERTLQGARLQLGSQRVEEGRIQDGLALLEGGRALAEARGDAGGQARALVQMALASELLQDVEGTAGQARRAAELAIEAGEPRLAGDCWMIAGQALFELDPEGSRAAFAEALAAWGTTPETLGKRASVTYNLAALDLAAGEADEARVRFREAKHLADEAGNSELASRIEAILAEMESG